MLQYWWELRPGHIRPHAGCGVTKSNAIDQQESLSQQPLPGMQGKATAGTLHVHHPTRPSTRRHQPLKEKNPKCLNCEKVCWGLNFSTVEVWPKLLSCKSYVYSIQPSPQYIIWQECWGVEKTVEGVQPLNPPPGVGTLNTVSSSTRLKVKGCVSL